MLALDQVGRDEAVEDHDVRFVEELASPLRQQAGVARSRADDGHRRGPAGPGGLHGEPGTDPAGCQVDPAASDQAHDLVVKGLLPPAGPRRGAGRLARFLSHPLDHFDEVTVLGADGAGELLADPSGQGGRLSARGHGQLEVAPPHDLREVEVAVVRVVDRVEEHLQLVGLGMDTGVDMRRVRGGDGEEGAFEVAGQVGPVQEGDLTAPR